MLRDRLGRGLMSLAAIGAIAAFLTGVHAMQDTAADRIWVEAWRTFGFLAFAALFALLAIWPRSSRGIWEIVFTHKTAMVIFALFVGDVPESMLASRVDLTLVAMVAVSWWLCRGWQSWAAKP